MTTDHEDTAFLFGAGAEVNFGLPSGEEYAKKTIFYNKDTKDELIQRLFERVKNYYDNGNKKENSYSNYVTYFINSGKTITKAEQKKMLYFYLKDKYKESMKDIDDKKSTESNNNEMLNIKIEEEDRVLFELLDKSDKKEFNIDLSEITLNDKLRKLYENKLNEGILIGYEKYKGTNKDKYEFYVNENLCTNINFFELDRLYHTIIDPAKYGIRKYWGLINYYWCCFHLIYSRCYEKLFDYKFTDKSINDLLNKLYGDVTGIDFKIIHKNIEEMIKKINNKKDAELFEYSYYYAVSNMYPGSPIFTTNYSPYACICKKPIFLHGNIWTFEKDRVPELIDYKGLDNSQKGLFPYLLCQSALKPIIHPEQILAFSNMIEALEKVNRLVIVGYCLSDDDNHINSIIRWFLNKDEKNKLIYINYVFNTKENDEKNQKFIDSKQIELAKFLSVNKKKIIVKTIYGNSDINEYNQFLKILENLK